MSKIKVLIVDPLASEVLQTFSATYPWYHFDYRPELSAQELSYQLSEGDYSALIVGMKDINEEALRTWRNAKPYSNLCVVRAGSEPSHIDYAAAVKLNITVMNTPGASKAPVIDYITKRIENNGQNKVLSIIGFGAIGKEVAKVAQERGYLVKAYSPHLSIQKAESYGISYADTPQNALKDADVVVLTAHLVTNEAAWKVNKYTSQENLIPSEGIINQAALENLKKGAKVINPSRPWLIEVASLKSLLEADHLSFVSFNTGVNDLKKLNQHFPDLMSLGNVEGILASSLMTPAAKSNVAKAALKRVINFCDKQQVLSPIFGNALWSGSTFDIKMTKRIESIANILTPPIGEIPQLSNIATNNIASLTLNRKNHKEKVIFVGAGVESLVSVMEFVQQVEANGTRDNYHIIVVDKEAEAACGTTFGNGGNVTAIEGLTGLKLGNSSLTRFHKAIESDPKSDGWLVMHPDRMTPEQRQWCILAYKLSRKEFSHIYYASAQTITNLGKVSMENAKAFFAKNPHLKESAQFQYLDKEDEWLIRIHDKPERRQANFEYFQSLGVKVKLMDFKEITIQQPGLKGLMHQEGEAQSLIETGGVAMHGGCINARAFTRGLACELANKHDVVFHYRTEVEDILINAKGQVVGLESSQGFINADKVIISSGIHTKFFKNLNISIPVQPVGGCTLTIPVSKEIHSFPMKPFKMVTEDGVIVFSPHVPPNHKRATELRVGGMYWYDPLMNSDTRSPQAKYGLEKLKYYVSLVFPELYETLKAERCFNEWVGFRPYTPDNVPIIDELKNLRGTRNTSSGIWINMGHGPGGTSYSFASAKLLVSQILGKPITLPGVESDAFSLERFNYYRTTDKDKTYVEYMKESLHHIPAKAKEEEKSTFSRSRL